MKNMYKIMGLLALAAGIWGCHQTMEPATKPDFTAQLEGGQEVPPVKTDANGEARFFLSPDGRELRYDIVVHKLVGVTMAHLHLGAAGTNGDHIAWLYPPEPPPKEIPGEFNGTLADGSITADHLMGPMAGKSIADLVAKMKAGDIYVNVHTKAQPDGEIRGQVH